LLKEHARLPPAARPKAIADAVLDAHSGIEDDLPPLIVEGNKAHGL
jgi:hypothetical protein